ncbi:MAG TPA: molybdopterin molybdotransferase MoeA, partial [Abditibacteriaceae bacterium]|nr:molybdopterin molybdotransferase MoeA [Abditibacteriaceae bacterium]
VRLQPRVGIITTGEELVAVGAEIGQGQIRDSNSFTLEGLARATGALVSERRHVGDEHAPLEAVLRTSAQSCDAIITSGGVSAGDFDPVRDVLQEIATVHFWKIAMKPGRPVMFATLKTRNSKLETRNHSVPIFGLPGNPVSVMVTFEQFVRPALLKMQSRRATRRITVQAAVDSAFRSPAGKVDFIRALVRPDGDGWTAHVAGEQSSGRLSTMTRSNALLIVPADVTRVEAGQKVTAQMTDWPEIE